MIILCIYIVRNFGKNDGIPGLRHGLMRGGPPKFWFLALNITGGVYMGNKAQFWFSGLRRTASVACTLLIAVALAACTSTAPTLGPTQPPPPAAITQPSATPVPSDTPAPTLTATVAATSVPAAATQNPSAGTPLDPCALIDSKEASQYTGGSFGQGVEEALSGGALLCTYGANTANVFLVEVAQAKDVATAQADKAQFLADLQSQIADLGAEGLQITELPNFADGATMGILAVSISGVPINGSAIGVLKGATFFGFSDVVKGGPAPSATAVLAEAQTVLGRIP
jgi:hypothetical protein